MIPGIVGQGSAGGGGGPPPGPDLWTPAEIATALWLDADDAGSFTLTGSDIDQWNDKSGNARHATPPTATKPTRTASGINSKGSVVFASGTDPLLSASFANPAGADGFIAAIVARRTGQPVNFSVPFCKGAANTQYSLQWANTAQGNISYWRNNTTGGNTAASPSSTLANDTDYLWSGTMGNANIRQYLQGTLLAGAQGAATRSFGTASSMTVGSSPDSSYVGNRFQGQLAELVLVHADMTDATRQLLEGYLAWKWGLQGSLPGGHPYASAAPTV